MGVNITARNIDDNAHDIWNLKLQRQKLTNKIPRAKLA
jgi:hypothetical protein